MIYLEAIEFTTVDDIKTRLKAFPSANRIGKKADLSKELLSQIKTRTNFQRIYAELSELEQWMLQEAVHSDDGRINYDAFIGKYEARPLAVETEYTGWREDKKSLLLSPYFYPSERYAEYNYFIPDDIKAWLRERVPKPHKFELRYVEQVEESTDCIQLTSERVEQELHAVMQFLKQGKLKVSEKTGLPSKALLNAISKQLHEFHLKGSSEEMTIKAFGWVQILRAAPWVSEKAGLLSINSKKFNPQLPIEDTLKTLFQSWLKSKFDEFNRITEIKGQKGKGARYFTALPERRDGYIKSLKQLQMNQWLAYNEFDRFMIAEDASIGVHREPLYLYIHDANYGRIKNERFLNCLYGRCILMEYLAILGMIDVAYTLPENIEHLYGVYFDYLDHYWDVDSICQYDGLKYIRLTELGAYILGLTNKVTKKQNKEKTPFNFLPKYCLQFTQPLQTSETLFLSTYADELKDNTFQLSIEKLVAYVETGNDLNALITFLEERDTQDFFPIDAEALFTKIDKHKKAVKKEGEVILLTCETEEIAKNIAGAPKLNKWCQRHGEKQLVIPKNKENQFRELINAMTYAMPVC